MTESAQPQRYHSSPLLIAVAWMIVGVPAAWGVEQTLMKSLTLFRSPPAANARHASALVK